MPDPFPPSHTADPSPEELYRPTAYQPYWVPAPRPRNRAWLHGLLFVATVFTTTFVGIDQWLGFRCEFDSERIPSVLQSMTGIGLVTRGFWYSATILLILGAHELGHYFACRYYRIDASLPYFLPVPIGMIGTLGAFIRIRQPISSKRVLFDVGIAGPIAGFVFAVPALLIGMALSNVVQVPSDFTGLELGEPLLYKLTSWFFWGNIPDGYSVNMHPMAFAAWFGMLATVLNLFPIGQLDGGHIAYTVLGRRWAAMLTRAMVAIVIALTFVSLSWLLWAALLVAMLFVFGVHHPPTMDDEAPLDPARKALVVVALAIFILCFMPAPIQPLDLIK